MTNTDLLPTAEDLVSMKNGTYKPKKKRSLVQAAQLLQDRWTKATGRKKPFEYNDKNVDILSDMLADEALVALQNDSNAIGWYDNKIKSAKSVMRLVEPRIMDSKENEALFDFVLAVTSNGQAVTDNFALATEMFVITWIMVFYQAQRRSLIKAVKEIMRCWKPLDFTIYILKQTLTPKNS